MSRVVSNDRLTVYPRSSWQEYFAVFFPIVGASFLESLTFLADKIMLSFYDYQQLAQVLSQDATLYSLMCSAIVIPGFCQVFVGQHYGAGKFSKVASAPWQMFLLSIGFSLIYFFSADFVAHIVPSAYRPYGYDYFRLIFMFTGFWSFVACLNGFFLGIGYVRFVFFIFFLGAVVNVVMNYLCIFGYGSYIPAMGSSGAAVASISSEAVKALVLCIAFFSNPIRDRYQVLKQSFESALVVSCFKKGGAISLSTIFSSGRWIILSYLIARASEVYLSLHTMALNTFYLPFFLTISIEKTASVLASNYIGARCLDEIDGLFKKLLLVYCVVGLILFTLVYAIIDSWTLQVAPSDLFTVMYKYAQILGFLGILAALITGLRYLFIGLLTACGDAKSVLFIALIVEPLSIIAWVIGFEYFNINVVGLWILISVTSCFITIGYFVRFQAKPWRWMKLI